MADRYWVWGTGNWDASTTTHWSASSGGATGASVPTSADNVIFDSLSNATAYTVTITATANCANFTMAGPLVWAVTWAGSSALNIYGSLNLSGGTSGITANYNWTLTFKATSWTKTLDFNSVPIICSLTFNWVWWTFQQITDIIFPSWSNPILTRTNGVYDANSKTITFQWATWQIWAWFTGTSSFYNLTHSANWGWTLVALWNFTVSNTLTLNWTSATNRTLIRSDTKWTVRTINVATIVTKWFDWQDITAAGAANWDLTAQTTNSHWDCWWNTWITFTTPATTDCSAGTTWSTATWSSRVPLPQDTATFSGAGRTITQDMSRIGSVNFTGSSGLTWTTSTACSVFGSINLTNLGTLTASTQKYTLEWRWSNTITNAGKTWAKPFDVNAPGGTYTLQDDFTSSASYLVFYNGTFTATTQNLTFSNFQTGTGTKAINMGSGTWEMNGTSPSFSATWLTFNAGTSTLKLTYNWSTSINAALWSLAWNNFWNATQWTCVVVITGSNSFNQFKVNAGRTQQFTATTNQTIADPVFVGTSGAWVITIGSASAASHTITKSGGGTVTADYCSISRSTATPASTWTATNSTNGGNNSGWTFLIAPLSLSQTLTLTDAIKRGFFANLSQTLALFSGMGNFAITKALSQTLTLASNALKSSTRSVSETLTLVSNALKKPIIDFGEIIALIDSYAKVPPKILYEALVLSDSAYKRVSRIISETLTIIASDENLPAIILDEIIVVTDSVLRSISKALSEVLTFSDSVLKSVTRSISEVISMADVLVKEAWKLLSESVTVAGAMGSRAITRAFSETVTLVMEARKLLNGLTEGLWTKIAKVSDSWTKTPRE